VQLGELQKAVGEFKKRGARLVALSVDPVETSRRWAKKRGFTFELIADTEMKIIDRFGIRNKKQPELALHAIYIMDADGRVFYRKIARRRAYSPELLDAIDYFRSTTGSKR
jgi:peroxiredoxin